jgi:8-oxo-dGTP pyrophosphatase MutT (NUDIX family)
MAGKWPKIRSREISRVSPWMSIIAREVEFARDADLQIYHAVEQADYVSIVAVTPDGRFPLVHQYRPTLEAYTWELPCGTVDPGEDAAETCRRELLEETGFTTASIKPLGNSSPCTGRLNNRIHAFFVTTGEQIAEPELGITVRLVTPRELARMIRAGEFVSQLHVGSLMLAELYGLIELPKLAPRRPRVAKAAPKRKARSSTTRRKQRSHNRPD